MNLKQIPLVVTDGVGIYEKVIGRVLGPGCLYGQVIKTRRNDRIVKVERSAVVGDGGRLEQALHASEAGISFLASKIFIFARFETARPVGLPIRGVLSGGLANLATVDDGSTG